MNISKEQISRMIIECRSQDGQIDEWGERELADDILALITQHTNSVLQEVLESYKEQLLAQCKQPEKDYVRARMKVIDSEEVAISEVKQIIEGMMK